jgi:uncharacterized membrane-anchored protein YitT (DUF2179 family)
MLQLKQEEFGMSISGIIKIVLLGVWFAALLVVSAIQSVAYDMHEDKVGGMLSLVLLLNIPFFVFAFFRVFLGKRSAKTAVPASSST